MRRSAYPAQVARRWKSTAALLGAYPTSFRSLRVTWKLGGAGRGADAGSLDGWSGALSAGARGAGWSEKWNWVGEGAAGKRWTPSGVPRTSEMR